MSIYVQTATTNLEGSHLYLASICTVIIYMYISRKLWQLHQTIHGLNRKMSVQQCNLMHIAFKH